MSVGLLDRPNGSELLTDAEWTRVKRRQYVRRANGPPDISSNAAPFAVPFGDVKLVFSEPPPAWCRESILRVCELGNLPANWDSYGARVIDPNCAVAAIELIRTALPRSAPAPAVVPTNRGGIQLEWHRGGVDLEIAVASPSRFHVVFANERTGEELEWTLTGDLQPLLPLLKQIPSTD